MKRETTRKAVFAATVAGLSLLVAGIMFGQENQKGTTDPPLDTVTDSHFATEAAAGGIAEVRLGRLAEEKGSSESVKNFGKRMVEDHSKANGKLTDIASQQGITLPTEMDKKDQATYDHLSSLSGKAFDQAYARDMVNDHVKDIAAFKQESQDGKNEAVKNFASETLPTLETHLKLAHQMAHAVGASTSAKNMNNTTK